MDISLDYSNEAHHDQLFRNLSLGPLWSIQNSLGYRGDSEPRTLSAKIAWIGLQLRNAGLVITMAANVTIKNETPLSDPGTFHSLLPDTCPSDLECRND